jgi:hypothetical protein
VLSLSAPACAFALDPGQCFRSQPVHSLALGLKLRFFARSSGSENDTELDGRGIMVFGLRGFWPFGLCGFFSRHLRDKSPSCGVAWSREFLLVFATIIAWPLVPCLALWLAIWPTLAHFGPLFFGPSTLRPFWSALLS